MKRECRRELSVSRRDMARAMSRCIAIEGAGRFNIALRSDFFGFWYMKPPIRESHSL